MGIYPHRCQIHAAAAAAAAAPGFKAVKHAIQHWFQILKYAVFKF